MSGRAYLLLVVICALWFGVRAATQPAFHDFDESGHLRTVAQIREFGGLPGAEQFPAIISDRNYDPYTLTYHSFPPYPYLVIAAATALAQTEPTLGGVLGVARAFSAVLALVAVVATGLAVRNLGPPGSTWSAPGVVTGGLAILPGVHSLGASVTATTWAFAAVAACVASITWAMRRSWSPGSTLAVAGAVTFVVASRPSAYPVVLLFPLATIASRLDIRSLILRLAVVAAAVTLVNGWWLLRNALVTGDLLGAGLYIEVNVKEYLDSVREGPVWRRAALTPWPVWTLLTSTDWLWLALSRVLGRGLWLDRIVWVDPVTVVLFIGMVVVPSLLVLMARCFGSGKAGIRFSLVLAASGTIIMAALFFTNATLSAQIGWFANLRDAFINSSPMIVAVASLADLRQDNVRLVCFSSGLAFAAATNTGFVLLFLP